MTIPDRVTFESIDPRWSIRITDDGSPTLVDRATGDSMHSGCGAIAETNHVYLQNSGIRTGLESGKSCRVLEIGLGSGMACLLTADLALRCKTVLDYVAIENNLTPERLILQLAFEKQGVAHEIVQSYCQCLRNSIGKASSAGAIGEYCKLTIDQSDASRWSNGDGEGFDAVYFDPYSPETNPTLWCDAVLKTMHHALVKGGRLVSYCVNRKVRDSLERVGFSVARVSGPIGGKREVLIATAI